MSVQGQATTHEVIGVGIAFATGGLNLVLEPAGVVPELGDNFVHAPPAVIVAAGLAFLFAGLTCMVRAKAGMNSEESNVPDSASLSHRTLAIAAAGALAVIGTWVAIGSGPRVLDISTPFEMRTLGETIGRTVFALGAVVAWIYVIALTVSTVRKFFGGGAG